MYFTIFCFDYKCVATEYLKTKFRKSVVFGSCRFSKLHYQAVIKKIL